MNTRIAYYLFIILSVFLLAEAGLRLLKWHQTYIEQSRSAIEQLFTPISGSLPLGKYHIYNHNISHQFKTSEFEYEYQINGLGVRENKDSFLLHGDSVLRILTLGDSFTEGVGADYLYSWPRALEGYLNRSGIRTEVFNAGVSGSDIWYSYVHLKDILCKLKPNLVIVCFNISDVTDYVLRGGMERFNANGDVTFRPLPWWEPLYRVSHVVRALTSASGYNYLLIKKSSVPNYVHSFIKEAEAIGIELEKLAAEKNFRLLFVAHPVPAQLRWHTEGLYDYGTISQIATYWRQKGYASINLWDGLKEQIGRDTTFRYSWPLDAHFNADGYRIMANVIADSLLNHPELYQKKVDVSDSQ